MKGKFEDRVCIGDIGDEIFESFLNTESLKLLLLNTFEYRKTLNYLLRTHEDTAIAC